MMLIPSLADGLRVHVRPEHFAWLYDVLTALYRPPRWEGGASRVYHTTAHIEDCLETLEGLAPDQPEGAIDKQLASLALIFHDVIYVPGQPDNEKNSALFFEGVRFALKDERLVPHVAPLILATGHKAEEGAFGDTTLAAVVDIDLSILGSGPIEYARYVSGVRREFGHVSDEAWRIGRSGFLAKMLERKRIFTLASMRADYEAEARRNMTGELGMLK